MRARYSDLLTAAERAFIETFPLLSLSSQALFVRMMMRRGTLFRESKLNYGEIGSTAEAVRPLCALGWVDEGPTLSLNELFSLSTKTELIALFGDRIPQRGLKKEELLDALLPQFPEARTFAVWTGKTNEAVYALTIMPLCDRFRLMFFGNLHQDWNEFVLADLGLFQYEKVPLSADSRAFQQRSDIDDYLHLYQCRERFDQGGPLADILESIDAVQNNNPWIVARRAQLMFRMGEYLERNKDYAAAQPIYSQCSYPGAHLRLIRVLERLAQNDAALQLARAAELAPESAAEQQQLLRILPRLYRRAGLPKVPAPISAVVETLALQLPKSQDRVEQAVLEYSPYRRVYSDVRSTATQ